MNSLLSRIILCRLGCLLISSVAPSSQPVQCNNRDSRCAQKMNYCGERKLGQAQPRRNGVPCEHKLTPGQSATRTLSQPGGGQQACWTSRPKVLLFSM